MKAVISASFNDKYHYFIPLVVYCWKKLGVDVICFVPYLNFPVSTDEDKKWVQVTGLIEHYTKDSGVQFHGVTAPEHKIDTYLQCSRLYAACLDLPEDEVLITSDIDMAVFKKIWVDIPKEFPHFYVIGNDLTPEKQYPICYAYARVGTWRSVFELDGKTYQQCLDEHLGDIECENMRGNYWGADQEKLYNKVSKCMPILLPRSNGQNQFAQNRVDRDDTNWRSYVNDELIDAHLWRDGFTDENHANIMELMRMKFPDEDFTWLTLYRNEYLKLI